MVQTELEGGLGGVRPFSMRLNRLIPPVGTTRKRTAMHVYPAKLTHSCWYTALAARATQSSRAKA